MLALREPAHRFSRQFVLQLRYPFILSRILVLIAFSSDGWSPEVRSNPFPQNIPADSFWSCKLTLHPTASTSDNRFRSCVRWTQAIIFFAWLGLFCCRLCWCLRTYALWNRQRWLLVLGIPAIGLEGAIILAGSINMSHKPIPIGLQQICIASPKKGIWSILSWAMPLSFDTAMSSLAIVRAMRVSRKLKTPLTKQLIRDGE